MELAGLRASNLVILSATLLAPSLAARGGGGPPRDGCRYGDWSEPTYVDAIRWGGVLHEPELVSRGADRFVLGNDVPLNAIPSTHEPFVAMRLPDHDLGRPPGDFLFVYPRAILAPNDDLHLVWAEPDDPPDNDRWSEWTNTSLWHARHDETGWSQPLELLRADRIPWPGERRMVAIDSAGRLHMFISAEEHGGDNVLFQRFHLRLTPDGWERTPLDREHGSYGRLLAAGRDTLYMAHIGAGGPGNPNSVFLRRSADGGESWTEPQRVYASGGRQASRPDFLRSPDGRLHLVWQEMNPEFAFDGLGFRHTASSDDGASWTGIDEVDIPDFLMSHTATIDACGTVHVVYESVDPEGEGGARIVLSYIRWHDGWSEPVRLFRGMPDSFQPGLALDERGTPILYFSGSRPIGQDSAQIGGFLSRLDVP